MNSAKYLEQLNESKIFLQDFFGPSPKIGLVLGSGLGDFVNHLKNIRTCPYEEIPHFHKTTVQGHRGMLITGDYEGIPVVAMQGRFHPYEGHSFQDIAFPIRLLGLWGIKALLLSNASGGINPQYQPGDLVLIKDHINLMGNNPLIGRNFSQLGTRFPDMGKAYNPALGETIRKSAEIENQELKEGVYCGVLGPSYETPAEINMMRIIGADLVGMSTIPEVITAHHMGIKVAAISCVTNHAAGVIDEALSHDDVKNVAGSVMAKFSKLITQTLKQMKKENL